MKFKRFFMMIIAVVILISTVGCQPTPNNHSVVSKGDGSLENKIENGAPEGYRFKAPDIYSNEYTYLDGKVTISFDENTKIINPDVERFPVYAATIEGFSKETIQKVLDVYFGDKDLITESDALTKDDINKQILEYKQKLFELESGIYVHPADDPNPTPDAASIKSVISELEIMLKNAPDTKPPASLISLDSYNGAFSANFSMENGHTGKIAVSSNKLEIFNNSLHLLTADDMVSLKYSPEGWGMPITDIIGYDDEEASLPIEVNYNISYSQEEAVDAAREFVDALNIDNMKYAYLGVKKPYEHNSEYEYESSSKYLYGVLFMRELDGISFNRAAGAYGIYTDAENPNEYGKPFYYERMIVYIGNDGIEGFVWTSPLKIEKLTESVELLKFEDVVTRCVDALYQGEEYSDILLDKAKVQTLELGYAMLRRPNIEDTYLIVPVWDVYVEREAMYYLSTSIMEYMGLGPDINTKKLFSNGLLLTDSEVTINAIDGSRIDRYLGY